MKITNKLKSPLPAKAKIIGDNLQHIKGGMQVLQVTTDDKRKGRITGAPISNTPVTGGTLNFD